MRKEAYISLIARSKTPPFISGATLMPRKDFENHLHGAIKISMEDILSNPFRLVPKRRQSLPERLGSRALRSMGSCFDSIFARNKVYTTFPHRCSYLEGEEATTLFVDPRQKLSIELYTQLSLLGFRRSGDHVYRSSLRAL